MLAWLFFAISPSILPQITASRTSYEAWVTLEGIFNTRSKSRKIQLQNQLRTLRKDSLSINEYFPELTEISEELREAGIIVDDGELSLIALNGLNESYDPFVTARVDENSFSLLLSFLHSYEACLSRHTEIRTIATANAV